MRGAAVPYAKQEGNDMQVKLAVEPLVEDGVDVERLPRPDLLDMAFLGVVDLRIIALERRLFLRIHL